MITYSFSLGGVDITDKKVSAHWSYGVNRIPQMTLRLVNLDEKAKTEFLKAFNAGKLKDKIKAGSKFDFVAKIKENQKDKAEVKFSGFVTGQHIGIDHHPYLEIIAQGKSVKLTEGLMTHYFAEKDGENDAAIMAKIAKLAGSVIKVDDAKSSIKQTQFFVYQQSPWRAMMARALANGYLFVPSADGDKLVHHGKIKYDGAADIELTEGGIENLKLEQDISSQFSSVKLSGWDIETQKLTTASEAKEHSLKGPFKSEAGDLGELKQELNLTLPIGNIDKGEFDTRAKAIQFYRALDLARGTLVINPAVAPKSAALKPMDVVNLKGIGDTFSGKFLVTAVMHQVTSAGWRVRVELGLHLNYTLFSDWYKTPPIPSMIGKVADITKEPDKDLTYLPIYLPGINIADKPIKARLAMPYASKEKTGFFFPPDTGDEVMVDFVGGDCRCPVILGSMYSKTMPAPKTFDGKNEEMGIYWSKAKLASVAKLKGGEEALGFEWVDKENQVVMDKDGYKILLKDKAGMAMGEELELKHKDASVITIKDKDNVAIETGKLAVTVASKMEIS